MTKKKSLLLQSLFILGVCVVLIGILVLTGCESNEADVSFNGDAYFVTSDYVNITNQEMFDAMIATEEGVFSLLDLVDDIVLRANFDVDDEEVDEFMTSLRDDTEDFDAWMVEQGFTSEDEIIRIVERNVLRQEAVYSTVVITDEEIQEAFEMWFNDDEAADFDELRDNIYDFLVSEQMGEVGSVLAELRYEAGFVIYDGRLADAYEQYLAMSMINVDIHEAGEHDETAIIARVGDDEITIGQLFTGLTSALGIQTAFELIDPMILSDMYEVDPAEVNEKIDELREMFGDEFDATIAAEGFESEEALFEYFETVLLQEEVFRAEFEPTEERLREMHAQMSETVSGSHILVDNEELAADLIEQLQGADDFAELFAELAEEYSSCPSGASGGDLGSWERGQMVVEFDDAIFAMEVGEFTTEPVETQHGYHIIYKTDMNDVPDFEDVRDELEATELAMLQQTGAMTSLLMNLRQEANISFTDAVLQSQFESIIGHAD